VEYAWVSEGPRVSSPSWPSRSSRAGNRLTWLCDTPVSPTTKWCARTRKAGPGSYRCSQSASF